jgi:predicted O-methyltransferase YrrM
MFDLAAVSPKPLHCTFIFFPLFCSMETISAAATQYSDQHTTPVDPVLQKIYDETIATHAHAHMISGHVQGQFLSFLSNMIRPRYILEIGSFTGYSAICLAGGLQPGGELHTIELRAEDANICRKNFGLAQLQNKIHLHEGNALDIIPTLSYQWDMVFIDADKTNYTAYYELVVPRLQKNGYIIADNVLFHGQVLEEPVKGKNALAIDAFNKHVAADSRTEQVMITLRDGLLLVKLKNQ